MWKGDGAVLCEEVALGLDACVLRMCVGAIDDLKSWTGIVIGLRFYSYFAWMAKTERSVGRGRRIQILILV
jgi:hypothetical protein